MSETAEDRLQTLGLTLPEASSPLANYVPALLAGNLLFVSGQISRKPDGTLITGLLGAGLTTSEGQAAAKGCALAILAQAKSALGSLEKIERVVKLTGFVASTPQFREQPQVINGASDLFVAVLGDRGRHTRAAVGSASLPAGAAVEIEAILQVRA